MPFNFAQLPSLIKTNQPITIVVVAANDALVIEALKKVSQYVPLKYILIGDEQPIKQLLTQYDLQGEIIHELDLSKMGEIAVSLVRDHKANLMMKGLIDTKYLLKPVVNSQTGIKKSNVLSHVAVLQYPDSKILIATDCAMNITPDANTKWAIALNALVVAKSLEIKIPKIGIVSAVEKVNHKIVSTTDAEILMQKFHELVNPSFLMDGPFAIDNLVSQASVEHKQIHSNVAGVVDVLLFPDLVSGNVFYKTSVFLANAKVAGLIIGADVPIILTSRADSAESKVNSILLGTLVALCN